MKTKLTHHLLAALLGVAQSRRHILALTVLPIWLVGVCNSKATLYSVELIDNDGPHITGLVDTVANTFTIQTWTENPGGTAFWSASDLPRTYNARTTFGDYDVPDNWNGTMSGWGFLNPKNLYHSGWNEGTTVIDGVIFDGWGIGLMQASYDTRGVAAWPTLPIGNSPTGTANFDSVTINPFTTRMVTTTADSGAGSLRQAIAEAISGDLIIFTNTLSGQTILLTSGQLDITNRLTIDATVLGTNIALNANTNSRHFQLNGTANATLRGLTLTNGNAGLGGAIILNNGATALISDTTLAGNTGTIQGGAIYNLGGKLQLERCTVSSNTSPEGGAIFSATDLATKYTRAINTTISGNTSVTSGGAVFNYAGRTELIHCTITGNTAPLDEGGGIVSYADGVTLTTVENSIVSGNSDSDVDYTDDGTGLHTFTSLGHNLIGTGEAAAQFNQSGDLTNAAPLLAPLGDYGGPTPTQPPFLSSPAWNGGATTADSPATDQRGLARAFGSAPDIGAVELGTDIFVTTLADAGGGSLREAATLAPSGSTVNFAKALDAGTILLTGGQLPVTNSLMIDATSLPNGIAVNGNASSRAFLFGSGTTNTLVGLTLTNCQADAGGAIFLTNNATLTLSNATVAGNHATLSAGAILNEFGQLTIFNSTLSGNSAVFNAGCVSHYSDTTLLIVNSTFTGNTCTNGGGAVEVANGVVELEHCTISGNASFGFAGGGVTCGEPPFSTVTARNSIIAGNSNGDVSRAYGTDGNGFTSLGHNLIGNGDAVESFNQPGDQTNAAPLLAPLANYGGPTLTMPPQPGSGAIDTGTNLVSLPATDQRGFARVVNGTVDIGAVEGVFNPAFSLVNPTRLGDGTFQFSFNNLSGAGFTILASTNVALPMASWSNLGPAVETPPGSGQFQFADPGATNYPQRFYQVRLP